MVDEALTNNAEKYRTRGVMIQEGCRIWGTIDLADPEAVSIGHHTVLGGYSRIHTHCPIRCISGRSTRVEIGHDVWIGYGVSILPGVTVGDRAVVGACSVVTKSVPNGAIVAGSPARVVGWRPGGNAVICRLLLDQGKYIGVKGLRPKWNPTKAMLVSVFGRTDMDHLLSEEECYAETV